MSLTRSSPWSEYPQVCPPLLQRGPTWFHSKGVAVDADDDTSRQVATKGLLASLPPALRAEITKRAQLVTYAPDATLPCRGPSPFVGVILSGLVRLYVTSPNGRQATVHYLHDGHAVGVARLFVADLPGEFQAVRETRLMKLQWSQIERLVEREAVLSRAIAAELARYVSASELAMESFVAGTVRQRLAAHLLRIAALDEDGRLVARVTQRGLADAVGSVRDVVARAVRDLRDDDVVQVLHGALVVLDLERLHREAAGGRRKSPIGARS